MAVKPGANASVNSFDLALSQCIVSLGAGHLCDRSIIIILVPTAHTYWPAYSNIHWDW